MKHRRFTLTAPPPPPPPSPQPQSPPPQQPAPEAATPSATQVNVDRATAMTEEFIDRGAPWSNNTSWQIVAGEAAVTVLLGVLFLFRPIGGSSTTLQLVGLILLIGALLGVFQLWQHKVRPDLEVLTAFRSGSGVTVGLVVVVATFFTTVTAEVSASLAVVVGIGFIIFGVAGILASFIGRVAETPLPLPGLIANAVMVVAGAVLMFAGAAGSGAVEGIFNLLGILMIVAAVALGGYAYLLRQQEASGGRS